MTNYSFKNGIKVEIPDKLPNLIAEWTGVKMAMSLILFPPDPVEPKKERKPYTMTNRELERRRKMFHKGQKKK